MAKLKFALASDDGVRALRVESEFGKEAQRISQEWLHSMDRHIERNLDRLTCHNIREAYVGLFDELKRWRSTSSNFTGFSEFLIFRTLYHTIGEKFAPSQNGAIQNKPTLFKSENYEIAQSVMLEPDGLKRYPDIYVKRKDKLISIIQVKIGTQQGNMQIENEVKSFEVFRNSNIKGLFITFCKAAFTEEKRQKLEQAGYKTIVLENNHKLISDVLKKFI